MIIEELIPELKGSDSNYISNLQGKYNEFKTISEVPPLYANSKIITDNLPRKTGILYNNIFDIVSNRYSYVFMFKDYTYTGYLANAVIDNYFRYCVINGENIENILYIDTKLLMQDYTKIIGGKSNDIKPALTYSMETLYREIELSPLIIWDSFNKLETDYEFKKIYEILNSRYRRMLGNLFFISGNLSTLNKFSKDISVVMNPAAAVDCLEETVMYIDDNNLNTSLKGGLLNG